MASELLPTSDNQKNASFQSIQTPKSGRRRGGGGGAQGSQTESLPSDQPVAGDNKKGRNSTGRPRKNSNKKKDEAAAPVPQSFSLPNQTPEKAAVQTPVSGIVEQQTPNTKQQRKRPSSAKKLSAAKKKQQGSGAESGNKDGPGPSSVRSGSGLDLFSSSQT
jgi:hypothetical protein